jgi:hypothetical protein
MGMINLNPGGYSSNMLKVAEKKSGVTGHTKKSLN